MRITFLGVGALGSTTAVLCRNLGTLTFVDFDRVESKNTLAQAFVKQSIGKNKAEALKAQLSNFYGTKCEAFGVRLTEENAETLLDTADLVIDAFDNQKSRVLASESAKRKGKPLLHLALSGDGTFGLVRWDERFAPDAEDHAGQATCEGGEHLPLVGLLAAAAARTIQDFEKTGQRRDSMVSLSSVMVSLVT